MSKSKAEKELAGTFHKSREKNNPIAEVLKESTVPAELINEYAVGEWERVTKFLLSNNSLVETDTSLLLAYCNEMGTYYECSKILKKGGLTQKAPSGYVQQRAEVAIKTKALDFAIKIADKFGFNPLARTKIDVSGILPQQDKMAEL